MMSFCVQGRGCKKDQKTACTQYGQPLLLLFLAEYLALVGLNLLAQISDRIHHFTALNSYPVLRVEIQQNSQLSYKIQQASPSTVQEYLDSQLFSPYLDG